MDTVFQEALNLILYTCQPTANAAGVVKAAYLMGSSAIKVLGNQKVYSVLTRKYLVLA